MAVFFKNDVEDGLNFVHVFFILILKMQNQPDNVTKTFCALFNLNMVQKCLDFGERLHKISKLETSPYLSYFKLSGVICNEI